MSRRQRSPRLSLVFERLSRRKRTARQAAKETRGAAEPTARQQGQAQPDMAAEEAAKG